MTFDKLTRVAWISQTTDPYIVTWTLLLCCLSLLWRRRRRWERGRVSWCPLWRRRGKRWWWSTWWGGCESSLKGNQSCFSLINFPSKCKLCVLVRKYFRNWRQTNYFNFISGRPPFRFSARVSLSVSLRSQLSTEAEILTERQIYSLAWPPVKTNKVRNTGGWLGFIGRRENCGRLWSLSEEALFDLLESAGGLVSGLPI